MKHDFLVTFATFALLLAACGSDNEAQRPDGPPAAPRVIAAPIIYEADLLEVEAVGTGRAQASAVIRAETAGEVVAVLFSAGDRVERGDVLLRLENEDQRIAKELAEVAVREAEQLLSRYRRIEDTGAVSDSAIDEARTALDAARLQLERAELTLERRIVRAPFAGRVGLTSIDAGARITPDTEITQLDARDQIWVEFPVPEEVFGRLTTGSDVTVTAFSEEEPRTASVIAVDSRINSTNRSFTARAAIDNTDDFLRPGMSFRVSFVLPGRRYPSVPEAAIVWGSDGAYVWGVENGKAERISISIVSRRKGFVLVDAPLAEGSLIIAEGVQKVRPGVDVDVVKPDRSSRGASGASGSTVSGSR